MSDSAAEKAAARVYPREHVGYKSPPPDGCRCDECFLTEARRWAYVAGWVERGEYEDDDQ